MAIRAMSKLEPCGMQWKLQLLTDTEPLEQI
jgi:hypothetical protein